MPKLLVTGGAGFIGSNFILHVLQHFDDWKIVNFDKLTYAGNLKNLTEIEHYKNSNSYCFIKGDINDRKKIAKTLKGIDWIINFAAESHVDRSISNPGIFIKTNISGAQVLLEEAMVQGVTRFLQVSTDEVYGSLGPRGYFREETPLNPSSPYAASKAAADLLALSYFRTYDFPVIISRCSNNYGPRQYPEKLIPLLITKALKNKKLPIYGDGSNIRDWIYVQDHCRALCLILEQGKAGTVYNIGAKNEKTNLEIARLILSHLNKPQSLIEFVPDRPGHDKRYAVDSSKLKKQLGWKAEKDFQAGIPETIRWYLEN